jgi:hypothetical protein
VDVLALGLYLLALGFVWWLGPPLVLVPGLLLEAPLVLVRRFALLFSWLLCCFV